MTKRQPRLVYVVAVPAAANVLLRGQLRFLRDAGFDVTVISSPGSELEEVAEREGIRVFGISIAREVAPLRDAVSLARLTAAFRRIQPDIVNASTAKGGLLGMLAASAARVPVRIYLLRGLRLETESGWTRLVLCATERIAVRCAHRVLCVSESLRCEYIRQGFASEDKCLVLGPGSSNGVDEGRFEPTPRLRQEAAKLRERLGIPGGSLVIGFVGRLVRHKGMRELLDAFDGLQDDFPQARLLLLGAGLAGDETDPELRARTEGRSEIVIVGHVREPAPYYAAMDMLAFPTYREGFPNVPLEAAAAQVPTVGFRATGMVNAVIDRQTGLLYDIGDARGLEQGIRDYLSDPALRSAHGLAARERVVKHFRSDRIWETLREQYEGMLIAAQRPAPRPISLPGRETLASGPRRSDSHPFD